MESAGLIEELPSRQCGGERGENIKSIFSFFFSFVFSLRVRFYFFTKFPLPLFPHFFPLTATLCPRGTSSSSESSESSKATSRFLDAV